MSINKQTLNAIVTRFDKKGFLAFKEVEKDRRNKRIILSESGKAYTQTVIPPAADAENLAMADMPLTKIATLVKLTTVFTENMEKEFSKLTDAQPREN